MKSGKSIVVIGGGAAGFFAAINIKKNFPQAEVQILEASRKPLAKILVSGGGRCNVTHHLFDPKLFAKNYPRGSKELLSLFSRFQAQDMVAWLKAEGVDLHVEKDGRMFPVTNKSETIANLFLDRQAKLGIPLKLGSRVTNIIKEKDHFKVELKDQEAIQADKIVIATGSSPLGHKLASNLGHTITELCPSLFTFKIKSPLIEGLMGLSFQNCEVALQVEGYKKSFRQLGPVLITHWGLSGPAILKLSAFGAHALAKSNYQAKLQINWLGSFSEKEVLEKIQENKDQKSHLKVYKSNPFLSLTKRFWESLLKQASIEPLHSWADLNKKQVQALVSYLIKTELQVLGKGIFKEEFVTAGGVNLKEINFKTMESKVSPGLYFAGEVLNVDGITGGFNFQNAWSGAWTIAQNIGN